MTGVRQAWRLLLRRYAIHAIAWLVPLWSLTAQLAGAYASVYPTLADRVVFVEQMRQSPGVKILYGQLPPPGRLGQLFQWEGGPYILMGASVMAILITTSALRGEEESGRVELTRGSGAGKWVGFAVPVSFAMGVVALFGVGAGLLLTYQVSSFDELTVAGGWAFAALVTAAGWAWVAMSAVACQLARSLAGARSLALSLLGITFCLRILTDHSTHTWLRWVSPQAWRDIVRPYTADRLWPLAVFAVAIVALAGVAAVLQSRRELYGAYLPASSSTARRWHVRGIADLTARLGRGQLAAWTAVILVLSVIFGAMSQGLTTLVTTSQGSSDLVSSVAPGVDVVQALFSFLTLYTCTCILVAAVQAALSPIGEERRGTLELQLATGASRRPFIMARALWAALSAAALTVVSAATMAAMTQAQITSHHSVERAFIMTISRFPGMFAAVGLAIAFVGLAPRLASLMWGIVAFSALAEMLGGLLNFPGWLMDASLLGHEVDAVGTPDFVPLLVLVCVGLVGIAAGTWGFARRNIPAV
ncbi:MAG: Tat pathway signal protein [Actinomycetaceae bacterium]|nr:Tat pathway signal protein [Actinomycetaceae bacterium]